MPAPTRWNAVAWTTQSFAEQYRTACSPQLQQAVCSKYVQMAKQFISAPKRLGEFYDRVSYLNGEAYELDINASWRAIVRLRNGGLALYAVGDHLMIERKQFSRTDLSKADKESLLPFTQVVCESVLDSVKTPRGRSLTDALDPRWLYRLDDEQNSVVQSLGTLLLASSSSCTCALITGGPGTGKTSILVELAAFLDWDPSQVALDVSDRVADYLASSLGDRVHSCRRAAQDAAGQRVVLVDDPQRWHLVQTAFAAGRYAGAELVVVAADLAQIENVISDRDLKVYIGGQRIQHHRLRNCYRQTQTVGVRSVAFLRHISTRFTKHVSETNIKMFAREHQLSVESANDMRFVSPGGSARIIENATIDDVREELDAIALRPLWQQWYPVCVVVEHGVKGIKSLKTNVGRVRGEVIEFSDTKAMRGVEYQHVLVLLSRDTLHRIMVTGRSGLSTDDYLAARNMRIPFSRATDSMVVFGLEGRQG